MNGWNLKRAGTGEAQRPEKRDVEVIVAFASHEFSIAYATAEVNRGLVHYYTIACY